MQQRSFCKYKVQSLVYSDFGRRIAPFSGQGALAYRLLLPYMKIYVRPYWRDAFLLPKFRKPIVGVFTSAYLSGTWKDGFTALCS